MEVFVPSITRVDGFYFHSTSRERREPTWGDPTHREIPRTAGQDDVEYSHLHIDTSFLAQDRNVAWPPGW